jgi:hypothetical protein
MKHKLIFALLMGIMTTAIISFTVIAINIGFGDHFLAIWLKSWGLAYLVVIPCILFIGPLVEKLVQKLLGETNNDKASGN